MPKTIVLAHGILGFGMLPVLSSFVNYFNGVRKHLQDQGHTVIAPSVNPVGKVSARGKQLAEEILELLPNEQEIHIVAHSMGGLDARFALMNNDDLLGRVKTLVMIGTPNRGSPVADAILDQTNPFFRPLLDIIPSPFRTWLDKHTNALEDLTTRVASAFDDSHQDRRGVRYIEVAGNTDIAESELFLFQMAQEIGKLTNEPNDGVVTKSSALLMGDEHLNDWPVDHAGEIGWTSPFKLLDIPLVGPFLSHNTPPHFARYDAIVDML